MSNYWINQCLSMARDTGMGDSAKKAETELLALTAKLQAAEELLQTISMCELGATNNNVKSYMDHWESRAEAAEAKVYNLAALVKILVHSLRKVNPNSSNIIRAMDYLTRKGLTGSILRSDEPQPDPLESAPECDVCGGGGVCFNSDGSRPNCPACHPASPALAEAAREVLAYRETAKEANRVHIEMHNQITALQAEVARLFQVDEDDQ